MAGGYQGRRPAPNDQQKALIQQEQDKKFVSVQAMFSKMEKQLAIALPKHMNADRMLRVGLTACRANPKLLECDGRSLAAAMMACAQTGLEPDGVLGHAHLVPFWSSKDNCHKVQFIAGYKGLIELMRRSGRVTIVTAKERRANDTFEVNYGPGGGIKHVPMMLEVPDGMPDCDPNEEPGDLVKSAGPWVGAYAWFKFADSVDVQWEYMTRSQIIAIRNESSGWRSFKSKGIPSPWNSNPIPMARKTVLRRLSQYAPQSPELARAVAFDEADDLLATDLGSMVDLVPIEDSERMLARSVEDLVPTQDPPTPATTAAAPEASKVARWRSIFTREVETLEGHGRAWDDMNADFGGNVPGDLIALANEVENRLGGGGQ